MARSQFFWNVSWQVLIVVLGLAGAMWDVLPAYGESVRPALAAGTNHMLALRTDGTVWAWGDNTFHQLGDATLKRRIVPGQVAGISGAIAASAGDSHNLVLLSNGEVWAWGDNTYGQLGDGTQTTRDTPAKVQGLSNVIAVAADGASNLALKRDGSVWAWGNNYYGQLGFSGPAYVTVPTQIETLQDVVGVTSGAALTGDGSVWTWGYNEDGQLGDGTRTNRAVPAKISITDVTRLIAGGSSRYAELQDGSVWFWGRIQEGELVDGTATNQLTPAAMPALQGYTQIAAGVSQALGVAPDGSIRAWGRNEVGEIGDGTKTLRNTPVIVKNLPKNPLGLAAGNWFSAAITADGNIWTWGRNDYGQLGRGLIFDNRPYPQKILGLAAVTVTAGERHGLALAADGSVWAWGDNRYGQLGVSGVTDRVVPQPIAGMTAAAIASCKRQNLALTAQGEVFAWGDDSGVQWGVASPSMRDKPVRIEGITSTPVAIGCGDTHAVVLGQDGRVWVWGSNFAGQLGSGADATVIASTPRVLAGLANVRAIAVGGRFTLALTEDGSLYGWGYNFYGQLGDGSNVMRTTPVLLMTGVDKVVAGYSHAFAKMKGGGWYAWGSNFSGELGTGDTENRNFPVPVPALEGYARIVASGGENIAWRMTDRWGLSLGITETGEVWEWGRLYNVNPGEFDATLTSTPKPVTLLGGITQAALGGSHALAVGGGAAWSWGNSTLGVLGQEVDLTKPEWVLSNDYRTPFNLGRLATATSFSAHADVTGSSAAPTITAALSVASADKGKTGKLYAAYLLPNGLLYFLTPTGWVRYDGTALPVYSETTLGEHTVVLWPGRALSGMANAVFYVGYGLSESDLLEKRKYSSIYTVVGQ